MSDLSGFRKDFTFFSSNKNKDLVYFDNAATSQRPDCVSRAMSDFNAHDNANPLRGLYALSVRATDMYEAAREKVRSFLNASSSKEIIFTRNASESLNLVAYTYGLNYVNEGDEIVISCMEHHSNILPWQMVCNAKGAKLVWLECDDQAEITEEEYKSKINERTKIVAITQVSNVFGIKNPVKEIASYAHKVGNGGKGAVVVIDGAQSVPHYKVDVRDIDADFFAFSGHKCLGPMGIGVLYGKKEILENMPPFLRGGEMIEYVTRDSATYAELPHKFEAGTVNASGAVGLAAAIDYLESVGFDAVSKNDDALANFIITEFEKMPHVHVIGSKDPFKHSGIVTFTIDGCHPHDIATVLDTENIAIRAGHHCAQPLMQKLNVGSTARASVYFYNTMHEAERFVESVSALRKFMGFTD